MDLMHNPIATFFLSTLRGYNHNKYWKRREIVVNPKNKTFILVKLYYLYYIKKSDVKNNCSFGTNLNSGSQFETPPNLPFSPNGIILGHDLHFGKNVTIYHQVTMAHGGGIIGNNTLFGTGSKVLSGINIGDNARIGMNAVVIQDVEANSTVVLSRPRIINKTL